MKLTIDKMPKNGVYLFSDNGVKPVSPNTYDRRYRAFIEAAGVEYLSPHKCRHTYGTLSLKGGAGLRTVQLLLGHSSIKTTEIYTHPDVDDLKNDAGKLPY